MRGMDVNPYQSPEAPGFVRLRDRWRARWPVPKFESAVLCGLVVFLSAAIAHRCQVPFDPDAATEVNIKAYTGSPLIAVEVVGVLASLAIIPVLVVRSIYLFWQKRILAAVTAISLCPVTFGALLLAMWIDAPTLVYAT
jgi:hypothetical protein